MLFSSMVFLSIFLPFIILIYFTVKRELRNYILLIASLIFYAWGEPRYLAIMLLIILLNYFVAIGLDSLRKKKAIMTLGIIGNLSVLVYFKYTNFFIQSFNSFDAFNIEYLKVVMPIGISFFTFQSLSYLIDVYRGEVKAQRNVYNLALYVSLFPQLIAGPIVKYHDIQKEIEYREDTFDNIYQGFRRFTFGLGKKVIIANTMGAIADQVFILELNGIDQKIAWIGAICYSLQLYFDFSGYSDMAIGLGRIFGFHFLENFNLPYISRSITEFWRRWHISLGSWFREYLYIPLGGNRKGTARTYINLFLVFIATGFWHGASWTFIVWGLWHGMFIVLERFVKLEKRSGHLMKTIRHLYTFLVVIIGWVIFRSETMGYAFGYIGRLFGINEGQGIGLGIGYLITNKVKIIGVIAILLSIGVTSFFKEKTENKLLHFLINIISIIILLISMLELASSTYNPFIYFRF